MRAMMVSPRSDCSSRQRGNRICTVVPRPGSLLMVAILPTVSAKLHHRQTQRRPLPDSGGKEWLEHARQYFDQYRRRCR